MMGNTKKDWMFVADEYICDVRAAAVLINNNKILMQREINGNEYALPGGHMKIGETSEDCLIREIREETGARIKCDRLLWSEECFWQWNGKKMHSIAFYYSAVLFGNEEIPDMGEFASQKDNCNVILGWMPIEDLNNVIVYPDFLKKEIHELNGPVKHFISKS